MKAIATILYAPLTFAGVVGLLVATVFAPRTDAAYRIRVTRLTPVLTSENPERTEADRIILEILPVPGNEHGFEGIDLAPGVLSGPEAPFLRDKLAKMWVDVWLSANEQIAQAKGLFVIGDPFHSELIDTEHPGDGRSALFAIFEKDLNHALSTLRLAYTVPSSDGGIADLPMIQRLKKRGHPLASSDALATRLTSKVTPSNKVHFDDSNVSLTFLNNILMLAESRLGHAIPVGGSFPAELKGLAHRVSKSGSDSLWFLFKVVLNSHALDGIPYELSGSAPSKIFAETTKDHLKGPYKNWPTMRFSPEMSYLDPSLNKEVELIMWTREQIAELFFALSSRVPKMKRYWLVDVQQTAPVMRRPWTWPETKNDPFVRSDFDRFQVATDWKSPAVPEDIILSWTCRYGFGG